MTPEFQHKFKRAVKNIFSYCELIRFKPSRQQAEVFECVQAETDHPNLKRIAVKSGQGPGKTAAATVIGSWRTLRRKKAMSIVTAPTQRQVRDVFMTEMRRTLMRAHPELQQRMKVDNFKLVVAGDRDWHLKAVTSNKPENMQGYHESSLTILFDEASGVPRDIWQTASGTLTNQDSLWVAIGNPNFIDCAFHDCFYLNADLWHTFTWNAEQSEHVDKENIRKVAREFGIESDAYRVRVLGEFPRQDPAAIMSGEDLIACTKNRQDYLARTPLGRSRIQRVFGIDLARKGSDESVIAARRGRAMVALEVIVKQEPIVVIRRALALQAELGWTTDQCIFAVDAVGMGAGVLSELYEAGRNVHEFYANARAIESNKYKNKVTEAWFSIRNEVRERQLYLLNDRIMLSQLSTRQYKTPKGLISVEDKDEYKKRIGKEDTTSPDRADAAIMAFYPFPEAESQVAGMNDDNSFINRIGRKL